MSLINQKDIILLSDKLAKVEDGGRFLGEPDQASYWIDADIQPDRIYEYNFNTVGELREVLKSFLNRDFKDIIPNILVLCNECQQAEIKFSDIKLENYMM